MQSEKFFSYIMVTRSYIPTRWWRTLCTRPTCLVDLHCANSLRQQYMGGHVAPLRHIVPIPSQLVFTNTNFIVFGLTHLDLNPHSTTLEANMPTIYTTDMLFFLSLWLHQYYQPKHRFSLHFTKPYFQIRYKIFSVKF